MDDPRILLLNRLYARKRKELKERVIQRNVEVEEEHSDERSVDHLLSFINGGEGDSKGTRNSKNKKKNRRRKDHQNSIPSNCTTTSNSTFCTGNAVDMNNKVSKELNSADSNLSRNGDSLASRFNVTKVPVIGDDRFVPEDEFNDCDLDDDIGPALKEKIDREVADFARRLSSDWPERMQEILSLGQER